MASRGGRPCIVEYSDISPAMSERRGADERLVYGAGNICNHFYTLDFVMDVIVPNYLGGSMYHVARKKIPCQDVSTGMTVTPIEWGVCILKNEIIIIILFYGSSSSRCHHHRPLLSSSEEIKSQLLSTT